MSTPSWQNSLRTKLASRPSRKIAILGIGNELRGDDAVGVIVARELQESGSARSGLLNPLSADGFGNTALRSRSECKCPSGANKTLIIDAGAAPEAFTGRLRRFAPDLVLMIDAAQMDLPPGTIRLIEWQDTIGLSASTHTLPLNVVAQYLVAELGCHVAVIGVQAGGNAFDAPLSPAVRRAANEITHTLISLLFAPSA